MMAGVQGARGFRQSAARLALTAGALLGVAGWLGWAVATRQPIGYRGVDFRDGGARLVVAVCAVAPLLVGVEMLWRLVRGVPDVSIDHRGVHVRQLFRTRTIAWADLVAVSVGKPRKTLLNQGEPFLRLHRESGKPVLAHPKPLGLTAEELRDAVLAGQERAALGER